MQLNPARGRKLRRISRCLLLTLLGLCSSTPRGDGNLIMALINSRDTILWFMQLNPARGRKHVVTVGQCAIVLVHGLCSSTPRGDGNVVDRVPLLLCDFHFSVYAAQPREGTETRYQDHTHTGDSWRVYAAQPREGTETLHMPDGDRRKRIWFMQLNPARGRKLECVYHVLARPVTAVYAAQPREGTETLNSAKRARA